MTRIVACGSAAACVLATLVVNAAHAVAVSQCVPAKYSVLEMQRGPIEALSGHDLEPDIRYRIVSMTFVRQDIFDLRDPEENNRLFRAANRYHPDTRESVIRNLILIREGHSAVLQELEESERILRNKTYLYDARVFANRVCGDSIEVAVVTRDVWTFVPVIGLTRTGGEQDYEAGFEDSNVLGSGSWVSLVYQNDLDREGIIAAVRNPNVRGSRLDVFAELRQNDDGKARTLEIVRPFYALNAHSTWGLVGRTSESEQGLYALGEKLVAFDRDADRFDGFVGFSHGLEGRFTNRWTVGYTYESFSFEPLAGWIDVGLEDRKLGYPWVSFERVEDDYEKSQNLDRIQSTEDVYLGRRVRAQLGYSASHFGGDEDSRVVGSFEFRDGWRKGERHLALFGASAAGRWNVESERPEDVVAQVWLRYRYQQSAKWALFAHGSATYVDNLSRDRQLLLGGDTGLRGYPNRYQVGNKRFLLTLEQRYFSDVYLLRIVRVGAAAFVDVGRAWFDRTPNAEPFGTLVDVGVGLRFESTRTQRDRVFHLDVAAPMQDGPGIGGVEVTFTAKQSL